MLMKLGIGLMAGTMALSVGAGLTVQQYGTVVVHVEEKAPGGNAFTIPVPMALARLAVGFIPTEELRHSQHELHLAARLAAAVAQELSKYPDTVLVQVQDGEENVLVRTTEDALVVDVDTPNEHVNVKVPLWGAGQILEVLAERAEAD